MHELYLLYLLLQFLPGLRDFLRPRGLLPLFVGYRRDILLNIVLFFHEDLFVIVSIFQLCIIGRIHYILRLRQLKQPPPYLPQDLIAHQLKSHLILLVVSLLKIPRQVDDLPHAKDDLLFLLVAKHKEKPFGLLVPLVDHVGDDLVIV